MSKAEKMRDRLANMQKERSEFERQKKELEAQMNIGRKNMGKIQKGLKNNDLNLQDQIHLETPMAQLTDSVNGSLSQTQNGMGPKRLSKTNPRSNAGQVSPQGAGTFPHPPNTDSPAPGGSSSNVIIPTGMRISDWCFVGPLDSQPPVVKSRELYETVRLLGRGSFGEVNLVKNKDDNKLFAIKTIFCSKETDMDVVLREIRFLRINRHPYVIDVHDAFITMSPNVVHIVMHYCESGTLSSIIQSAKKNKTSISETQIIKWTIQLALAMQFLHSNNTLHRDLKPMNVMLTEGGDLLKLADFGLALDVGDSSQKKNFDEAGTPYYTAPEMIQRESYSFPADCWSFGIILHQLMALERPFEGSSTADLVKAILSSEPPPLPPHYSDELKNISRELLRKNQQERMSMVGLLSEPIIVAKLNNFAQSYRPRHLEERIRRSHTKQLEQQLEAVSRSRRATLLRGKSEQPDAATFLVTSANNSPRLNEENDDIAPLLQELVDQFTDHKSSSEHQASSGVSTSAGNHEEKQAATPLVKVPSSTATAELTITAHHIEPESRAAGTETSLHSLHHSPSGHQLFTDHHRHHQHHHSAGLQYAPTESIPVLQKTLSHIIFDADTDSSTTHHVKVDESHVNDILVLGTQLSMHQQGTGTVAEDIGSPNSFPGGRKRAEIHKAIQQDQELEKGLTSLTEDS